MKRNGIPLKLLSLVAFGAAVLGGFSAVANELVSPMTIDRPGAVKPAGWLLDRARTARDGLTGHLAELDEHFRVAWTKNSVRRGKDLQWFDPKKGSWHAEGGAYWFDGLVRLAWQLDDPGLKTLATRRLGPVLDNVGTNSMGLIWWLNRNDPKERKEALTDGQWLLSWVLGTAVRPICAYYEATGDVRAKRTLENAFSCLEIAQRYGGSASFVSGAFETWRLTRSPVVAKGLDEACKKLAGSQFADVPWEHLAGSLNLKRVHERKFGLPSRHGVFCHEQRLSVLAAYQRSGDPKLKKALEAWCDFMGEHCEQPNGLLTADEEWGWAGAYRATETCVAAAEMYARIRMTALFADGRFGDEAERAYFNGGAAAVSRDFKRHVYFQMPNRTGVGNESAAFSSHNDRDNSHYRDKHWPLCCSAALNRILPNYVQGLWMKTSDGGVAAALYGPSTYSTRLHSGEVAFTEKTDYPFAETILLSVDRAPEAAFPLKLRLPAWCAAPELKLNGQPQEVKAEKGFVTLRRVWKAGDEVSLRFPMTVSVRRWTDRNDSNRNRLSVFCGPLTFAWGIPGKDDNTPLVTPKEPVLAENLSAASVSVVRKPMPAAWDWPLDAPVKLRLVDAEGRPLELVPYGCTKMRIAAFPVAPARPESDCRVKPLPPPSDGKVAIVNEEIRAFLSRPHYERAGLLLDPAYRARAAKAGSKPVPYLLNAGAGADRVELCRSADGKVVRTVPVADGVAALDNLEVATKYAWRAMSGGREVAKGTFETEDGVPRVCRIDGLVNVRDIGGYCTGDGRRVRQGLVYRTEQMNATAYTPKNRRDKWRPGTSLLKENVVAEARETFGFRTELDLRTDWECFGMTASPLGPDVRWVRVESSNYGDMKSPKAREAFARCFRTVNDAKNLPLVFHCAGGADRTGTLAFLIEGILGVGEEDMWKDWELTIFWYDKLKFNHWNYMLGLTSLLEEKFPKRTLQEQCVAYAKDCGITDDEIAAFRKLMLE